MYFTFGWPKVLAALEPGTKQEEVVYLFTDQDYFVLVSTTRIQLWTGGQHRVKLGTFAREAQSIQADGLNRKAYWSSVRRSLAVLTYNNVLHIYGMHTASEPVLAASLSLGGPGDTLEFKRVDLYLQQSQALASGAASACDVVGDGRSLLLGFSDGSLQLFSWQAKMRAHVAPFTSKELLRMEGARSMANARRGSFGDRERSGSGEIRRAGSQALIKLARSSSQLSRTSSSDRMPTRVSSEEERAPPGVECLDYCPRLRLLAAVLTDGRCALLRTGAGSLGAGEGIETSHWLCGPGTPATVVRLSEAAQLAALGLCTGEVALHRLWGSPGMEPLRIISLAEWGYEPEAVGSVADLQWAPDGRALAVGWRRSGLGIWSPAGCRLMCTLRQAGSSGSGSGWQNLQGLEGGVSVLAWGVQGYSLLVAEAASSAQVMELTLAKSLPNSHRLPQQDPSGPGGRPAQELYFLMADDRLLQISEDMGMSQQAVHTDTTPDLIVQHLKPPPAYVAANWPLQHAALSSDGIDLAVAGRRGLALYSRRSARWRLFGDISQEKELTVHALLWLPRMVLVCASQASSRAAASLLLFPRYHLDNASLLASYPLDQVPLAVDVLGVSVVVATRPLDIQLLHVDLAGALTPLGTPTAKFRVVRELSMMSVGQPLREIALVEMPAGDRASPEKPGSKSVSGPQHCVLLRAGGLLSVLDMELGSEQTLAEDVECFWLSGSEAAAAAAESRRLAAALDAATSFDTAPSRGDLHAALLEPTPAQSTNTSPRHSNGTLESGGGRADSGLLTSTSGRGEVEIPWWTYGARGMQLWFPSSLSDPVSPSTAVAARLSLDPELEFDREVYPIGISLAEVAIIGVTQRVARSAASARAGGTAPAHARLPSFQVVPETQPVLPCLLRRLLQQGRHGEAQTLAAQHSGAPHFARSLEWLLFTSLEIDADLTPSPAKQRNGEAKPPQPPVAGQLLTAAADLLRRFPQFAEIVVSVARKTDAAMWGGLFAAIGKPSGILEGLLEAGALRNAACCLVIVDRLEGPQASYALCLRLIRVAVSESQYDLVAELLRFVVPPGADNLLLGLPRLTPEAPPPVPVPRQEKQPQKGWLASLFGGGQAEKQPHSPAAQRAGANGQEDSQFFSAPEEDRAAWEAAFRLVGHHAWRLLDQGRLKAAAALGRALLDVGASLPALLLACRAGAREGLPSARACVAALVSAEREFPVASDKQAALDALLVKEACAAAASYDWLLALSLLLDDLAALEGVRAQQPALWAAFNALVQTDPRTGPYRDTAAAVSALPPPPSLTPSE